MAALRRHQLVRLSDAGWAAQRARAWDETAGGCVAHWAAARWPLVVTRQPAGAQDAALALGLPAPLRWQRRRIALQVPLAELIDVGEFPPAGTVADLLAPPRRGPLRAVLAGLDRIGVASRAYGGFGWQRLTGLAYLHADSDLDLHCAVGSAAAADAAAQVLGASALPGLRIDGELVFPDGSAVAWREWAGWRAGRVPGILVKRLHGVSVETSTAGWAA